jgi:alpha-tubulin suppressor-like RCC1 family protein/fibronectin type 3 domain-containing protein
MNRDRISLVTIGLLFAGVIFANSGKWSKTPASLLQEDQPSRSPASLVMPDATSQNFTRPVKKTAHPIFANRAGAPEFAPSYFSPSRRQADLDSQAPAYNSNQGLGGNYNYGAQTPFANRGSIYTPPNSNFRAPSSTAGSSLGSTSGSATSSSTGSNSSLSSGSNPSTSSSSGDLTGGGGGGIASTANTNPSTDTGTSTLNTPAPSVIVAPTPANAPTLSAQGSHDQAILSWTPPPGVGPFTYTLSRSLVSGSNYTSLVAGTSALTYTDTTVTDGTPYFYQVVAVTGGVNGNPSNEVPVKTIAPFAITSVAVAGNQTLSVNWPAVAGADQFTVNYGTVNGSFTSTASTSATSGINVSGLTAGTIYYFMVSGTNSIGSGVSQAANNSASGVPMASFDITSVSEIGAGQISLAWTASAGSTSYTVKYGTSPGNYTTTVSTSAASPQTVSGLAAGTSYYFRVSAVNSNGTLDSTSEQTYSPYASPAAPSALTLTGTPGNVALSWTASPAAGSITYSVLRSTVSGGPYTTLSSTVSGTTYNDPTVADGTTYYYVVNATNVAGTSSNTAEGSIRTISAFTLTSVSVNGSGSLAISWPVVTGASAYTLQYGTVNGTYSTTVSSAATSPTTVSALTAGTPYYFNVIATNAIGSGTSKAATSSLAGTPMSAFTLSSVVASSGQTIVTWAASTGSTSYSVLYGTASGNYTTTVANQTSPATITGLTNGSTYYWMVKAVNASGNLNASNELSSQPIAVPSTPATLIGQGTHHQSALTWTASTGSGTIVYNVYRSSTQGSGYAKIASAQAGTSFTDSAATDGSIYYYVVSAQNAGGESSYSNEVDVEPLNNFMLSSAVAGASEVDLAWASSTGATQYDIHYGTVTNTYTNSVLNQTSPKSVVGFTAGTQYFFSVTATNAHHGSVVSSNELSAIPMSAFTINALSQTGPGQLQVPWNASTGATSYDLKYGTTSGTYTTTLSNQTSPVTISSLTPGSTYYFMVTAKNASGAVDATTEQSATLLTAPNAPTGVAITAAIAQSTLTWTASTGSGTITYNILRSLTQGSGYITVASGLSTLTYNDTGLTNGSIYYYVVQAQNVGGTVNSSEVAGEPISAFTISSVQATSTQASLTWASATGATSYVLNYGTSTASYPTLGGTTTSTSATIAGINSPVTYYFMVTATNTHGGSVQASGEVSATSINPFTLTSVTQTGGGQVSLVWAAAGGATNYNVKYGTATATYTTTLNNKTSPATLSGLTPGTQYFFMVTATNANNGSLDGTPELSITPIAVPSVPTALAGTATSGHAALTWTASTGGGTITYNVLRSLVNGSGYVSVASALATTNYTDTTVSDGTTYYYVVTATNIAGDSPNSNQVALSPIAVPTVPTTLTGQGTHNNSTLAWTASTGSGTITYNIYRSLTSGSGYSSIATAVNTNTYSDATANDGTVYYYVVTSQNAGGESAYSNQVDVEPINHFLLGTATSGASQISLTWGSATGATQYDAKYGTVTNTYTTTLANQTSPYAITSLTPGTKYFLSVTATNAHHGSVISTNELSATPMSAFTITSATQTGAGQASLVWAASTGSTSYTVTYGTATGVYGTTVSTSATSPLTITGLSNGSTYYFMVTAVNANGSVNATTEQSLNLATPPTVPGTLTALATSEQVALTWAASTGSGAITYNVLRSTTSGSGYLAVAGGTGINTTTFTDTGLTDSTIYYYVIQSVNVAGTSANSAQIAGQPIAPFTITAASGGIGQSALTWAAANGASSYAINYGTVSGTYGSSGGTSATPTATVNGLTGGQTYYFMVTAVNAYNGSVNATAPVSATIQTAVSYTWTWPTGSDSANSFNPNKVEIASNVVRLKNQTPGDSSNATLGFGGGTLNGLVWDSVNSKLKIDPSIVNSAGELDGNWTPQYSNLVGYWKMNGTSGSSLAQGTVIPASVGPDGIFQNANGSVYPITGLNSAKQNQGITFDGTDDYVNLGTPAQYDFGTTTSFTLSAWAKWTSSTLNIQIIGNGGASSSNGYSLFSNAGSTGAVGFAFGVGLNAAQSVRLYSSNTTYNDGMWHHLAVSVDQTGKNISMFIDGSLAPITNTQCGTVSANVLNYSACSPTGNHYGNTTIGSSIGNNSFMNGSIDEAAIWNSALSASDVKTVYERSNANYSGTILSRIFNQGGSTSWGGLSWLTQLPYGKELPSLGAGDSGSSYSGLYTALPTPASTLFSASSGYWKLNETSGTSFADSSTTASTGASTGTLTYDTAKFSSAPTFDGSASSIALGTLGNLGQNMGAGLTIGTWIKTTSTAQGNFGVSNSGTATELVVGLNRDSANNPVAGSTNLQIRNEAGTLLLGAITNNIYDGFWHYLVFTAVPSSGTISATVDGNAANVTLNAGGSISGFANFQFPFTIGAANNQGTVGTFEAASFAHIGIWNRVLTATEINQLLTRASGIMTGNTLLLHLNDAAGTSSPVDSSISANTVNNTSATFGGNGILNTSAAFDGSTSHVLVYDAPAIKQSTLKTISFWMKKAGDSSVPTAYPWRKGSALNVNAIFGSVSNGSPSTFTFGYSQPVQAVTTKVTTTINNGEWNHIAQIVRGSTIELYKNGVLVGSQNISEIPSDSADGIYLSALSGTFNGSIDEFATWNRPLAAAEISTLYQRGANRVRFQARVCTTQNCSDDPTNANFLGPDGTAGTYFTEAYNVSTQSASPSGNPLLTSPMMAFANFFGSLTAQYYQYKAILESDVNPASFTPDLTTVSTGMPKYDGSSPTVVPIDGPSFMTLTGFLPVLGVGCSANTSVHYQLSTDKTTWYYVSGSVWTAGTYDYTTGSTGDVVNSNISTFPSIATGKLYVRAFMPSDTTTACELASVNVTGGDANPTTSANPQSFQISSITSANTQAVLSWNASANATAYTVCYATTESAAFSCGTSFSAGASTAATINGLTTGTAYYFVVKATDGTGVTYTSTASQTTPYGAPTAPASLAATNGLSNVGLTWAASTGAGTVTYSVVRATASAGPYTTLVSGISTPAYTDYTALNGTTYYYEVNASNAGGTSANTSWVSATPMGSFSVTSTVATGTQTTIAWSAASGATNYNVQYGTSSGVYSTTLSNQTSPLTITGLTTGTPYYILVTATNAGGSENAQSEVIADPVGSFTASAVPGVTQATLNWTAATGATSNLYTINYGTTSGTYTTTLTGKSSGTVITGLTADTTYYFQVVALNSNNGQTNAPEVSTYVTASATQLVFTQQPTNATAATAISPAITVTAEDASGAIVTNFTSSIVMSITTGANPGGSTLSGTKTVAAVGGVATFSTLSLNKSGAGYTLTATYSSISGISSTFNISAGLATKVVYTTAPSGQTTTDTSFTTQPVVSIEDANSNIVTTSTATVALALYTDPACTTAAPTAPSGVSSVAGTSSVAAVSGAASFSGVSVVKIGTVYLGASSAGLTSACTASFAITVGAVSAAQSTVTAATATVGSGSNDTITLTGKDSYGNASPTGMTPVTFSASNTGGTGSFGTVTSAGSGVYTSPFTGAVAGSVTLTASVNGIAVTAAPSVTVNPSATIASISFSTQPASTGIAGTALATQPVVTYKDASGNIVTASSATSVLALYSDSACTTVVNTAPGGGASLSGTTTLAASSGVVTYTNIVVNDAVSALYLKATRSSLTACSNAINVSPGAFSVATSTLTSSSTVVAGATLAVTLTALDANGNSNPSGSMTITYSSNSAPGTFSATVAAGSGVFTSNFSTTLAGSATLSGLINGTTITATKAITVSPAAAATLAFTTQPPSTATAGVAYTTQPVVTIRDVYGNTSSSTTAVTLTPYTDSYCSATVGAGVATATANPKSAVAGVASFAALTNSASGTIYMRATASGVTSACSTLTTISNAALSKLALTGASTVISGACYGPFTVTSEDNQGNATKTAVNTTINLSGAGSGTFYSDSACATPATSVIISSGTSTANYYVNDSTTQTLTLGVSDGTTSMTSASFTTYVRAPTQVSAGTNFSCALIAGGVQCWGINTSAQLGNGTLTNSTTPVQVSGLTAGSGVASIATGGSSACALFSSGALKCWGNNSNGQLGANTSTTPLKVPTQVNGLTSGVTAVAVSGSGAHVCAVVSGGAQCWGSNSNGQLGNNSLIDTMVPVQVSGLAASSGVTSIAAGDDFSCAAVSGGAQCWGGNTVAGYLGNASGNDSSVPVQVTGFPAASGVTAVSSFSHHSCLIANGAAQCWGNGSYGKIGVNTVANHPTPVQVNGLTSGVVSISAGYTGTCAQITGNALQCWGLNTNGQLGNNSTTQANVPTAVTGASSGGSSMSQGYTHACAIVNGAIKCWGSNAYGSLGNGLTSNHATPSAAYGLTSGVTSVGSGGSYTCAVVSGAVECFGLNASGQLGDGTTASRSNPAVVTGLTSGWKSVSSGNIFSCAMSSAGAVQCWGDNTSGQLGNNSYVASSTAVQVNGLTTNATALSVGQDHACAIVSGGVWCWGDNNYGELGNNSLVNSPIPVQVSGLSTGVVSIAAGFYSTCAVLSTGAVQCWGYGSDGEMANGTFTTTNQIPVASNITTGATFIYAGEHLFCAVVSGASQCWGINGTGDLGIGTTTSSSVPVTPTGLAVASSFGNASMGFQTCAVVSGAAFCWGQNNYGKLGTNDATQTNTFYPGQVYGLTSGVTSISPGGDHTCAIVSGGLQCWGADSVGQLGLNNSYQSLIPISVTGFN